MPGAASKISLLWECAQILGLGAVGACLLLMLLPVRARAGPALTLALRHHQWLGWGALASAIAHAALSIIADPVAFEHLKPTAPYYEWAGLWALLLLLLLSPGSMSRLRRQLWKNHRRFQGMHVAAACVLMPALAAHVLATQHFVRGAVLAPLFIVLCSVAVLALLRPRRAGEVMAPEREITRPHRLVFGRHSRKVLLVAAVALIATGCLFSARASIALRGAMLERAAPVKVAFPHEQHRAVGCVECHHNFTDRTGSGSCYACHRSARPDLRVGAEARFHDFCLGCHRAPPRHFEREGPVTGCSTCHVSQRAP